MKREKEGGKKERKVTKRNNAFMLLFISFFIFIQYLVYAIILSITILMTTKRFTLMNRA